MFSVVPLLVLKKTNRDNWVFRWQNEQESNIDKSFFSEINYLLGSHCKTDKETSHMTLVITIGLQLLINI